MPTILDEGFDSKKRAVRQKVLDVVGTYYLDVFQRVRADLGKVDFGLSCEGVVEVSLEEASYNAFLLIDSLVQDADGNKGFELYDDFLNHLTFCNPN